MFNPKSAKEVGMGKKKQNGGKGVKKEKTQNKERFMVVEIRSVNFPRILLKKVKCCK